MSFFEELKRRNVFKVGIAYAVATWVLIQISDILLDSFGAPPWVMKSLVLVLAVGFFITLFFAWAFEITPEGVKRESEVDRSQSVAKQTGQKLNYAIIGLLVVALGYFVWESRFEKGPDTFSPEVTSQITQASDEKMYPAPFQPPVTASADSSIAVLPFANRSNEEEDLFFTDGIHDDLLTQLAKIDDLKVISRTSVMKYRGSEKTIPEIAAELGVSTILEGGIQRAGKRIRINAQLIDVVTDEHLWAETFDREMTVENIFDIQSEITRQIVTAVRGELSTEETGTLALRPTDNLDAYEAYLKAKAYLNDPLYSQEKYINAEVWLKEAVASDPRFALAWSLLVTVHGQAIWLSYDDSQTRLQAMLDALNNAEKFGPGLPETIAARAEYLYRTKSDFRAAEPLFAQASQAKPGDSDLLIKLGTTERRTGHFEQAITHYQMAIDLDPANLRARTTLVETLVLMGAYQRAEPLVDLWIEKFPETQTFRLNKVHILLNGYGDTEGAKQLLSEIVPNIGHRYLTIASSVFLYSRDFQGLIDLWSNPPLSQLMSNVSYKVMALSNLAKAYFYLGDVANAEKYMLATIQSALDYQSANVTNQVSKQEMLALTHARMGQFEKARETVNLMLKLRPESDDSLEGPMSSITHAMVLGMIGEREESLAEIERLLNTPAGLNHWDLALSPDWDFFRDDERFNELARPLNLDEAEQ